MYFAIKTDENLNEGCEESKTYEKDDINDWDVDDVVSWLTFRRLV